MIEVIFILVVIVGVIIAARRSRDEHRIPPRDRGLPPPPSEQVSPYAKAVALRRAKHQEQKKAREERERRRSGDGRRPATPTNPKPKPIRLTEQQIDKFIDGLPRRTLEQLRQQWLNLVRLDPAD